jgi:hypothetical protein
MADESQLLDIDPHKKKKIQYTHRVLAKMLYRKKEETEFFE